MKVRWLGHACFMITSDAGVRIIIDPYKKEGGLKYGEISEAADIVLVSHDHFDHSNAAAVRGNPRVIKGTGTTEVNGLKVRGIATFHDEAGGSKRGTNTAFVFEVDGIKVCHLGDLGHALTDKDASDIGKVDVLLVPVGGFFTIDASVAGDVTAKLAPRVVIPMHFKTDKVDFPIASVDDFLKGKTGVERPNSSEAVFEAGTLPSGTRIVVLKPAL